MEMPTPSARELVVKYLNSIDEMCANGKDFDAETELENILDDLNKEMDSSSEDMSCNHGRNIDSADFDPLPIALSWAGMVSHCVVYTYASAAPMPIGVPAAPGMRWRSKGFNMSYISAPIFRRLERAAAHLRSLLERSAKNSGATSFSISISAVGVISIGLSFSI